MRNNAMMKARRHVVLRLVTCTLTVARTCRLSLIWNLRKRLFVMFGVILGFVWVRCVTFVVRLLLLRLLVRIVTKNLNRIRVLLLIMVRFAVRLKKRLRKVLLIVVLLWLMLFLILWNWRGTNRVPNCGSEL